MTVRGESGATQPVLFEKLFKEEITETGFGDMTYFYFLPDGGAYVFPGDTRYEHVTRENIEEHFLPSFSEADAERCRRLFPGDGPCYVHGTKEELYALLEFDKQ
jgi:hypothetical protein